MHFLTQPPRFLFFTGKEGHRQNPPLPAQRLSRLATQGKRVLLVSTRPGFQRGAGVR